MSQNVMYNKVAVIGTGLSATASILELIEYGYKPIVLDKGLIPDSGTSEIKKILSQSNPCEWDRALLDKITKNDTLNDKHAYPLKLSFGTSYFYGKSIPNAPVIEQGAPAPYSYAKGGLSMGWGATVLPPDKTEFASWPIDEKQLIPYYSRILNQLPFAAVPDGLSDTFPLHSTTAMELTADQGNVQILNKLKNAFKIKRDDLCFGRSRLLTAVEDCNSRIGCKYCGQCMSGCVYDSIYKTSSTIDELIENNKIEYISNVVVDHIDGDSDNVIIYYFDESDNLKNIIVQKVFLGAGVVNSTRIILKSLNLYDKKIKLQSTLGFVAPFFSFSPFKQSMPDANTQPGLFLEYKMDSDDKHWVHTQLSVPNELVYQKLKISLYGSNIINALKKYFLRHLIVAHVNIRSELSNGYFIKLKKKNGKTILITQREKGDKTKYAITCKKAFNTLKRHLSKIHCYGIPFTRMDALDDSSFHAGGTLPMASNPQTELETDVAGSVKSLPNVHIIDSSTFPSIPATTIGLLSMANSMRITNMVVSRDHD